MTPTRISVTAAFLLATGLARAQNTQLLFEASTDAGLTWQRDVSAAPLSTVYVRLRIRLVNQGTHTTLGLAGITHQPTLTNWNPAADTRLPFTTESDGSGVAEDPQTNTGRIIPFASAGMSSLSASGLLTSHVDPGNILRFAGANAVTPTTNNQWGVLCGQLPNFGGPTGYRSNTDVVVFRYSIRPGDGPERTLTAAADPAGILNQRGHWYRTDNGMNNLFAPIRPEDILPVTIRVIPCPASLALLALAACALPQTRRPRRVSLGALATTSR